MARTYLGYTQDEYAADLDQYRELAINVKSQPYGAVGDGVTDDTAAIQAAIAAGAALDEGATVECPSGSYLISTSLKLKSKVTLRARGRASITVGSSTINVIEASAADVVTDAAVEGLELIGHTVAGGNNVVRLEDAVRVRIAKCHIREGGAHGVFALNCTRVVVEGNEITAWNGTTGSGVNIQGGIDCTVRDNEIHDGAWLGVNLDGTTGGIVQNNVIYANGHSGVNVYKASLRCQVSGNLVRDLTGGSGIVVDGEASAQAADNAVVGNIVYNVPTRGISARMALRTLIANNQVREAAQNAGIYIHASAADTQIVGNVCENNTIHGIRIESTASGRTAIIGNRCQNNGQRGIWTEKNLTQITGNYCYLNGQIGIFVQAGNCVVTGNHCLDNGQTTDNTYDGIVLGSSRNVASGNWSGNTAASGSQRYGFNITAGTNNCVTGNVAVNNETANLNDAGTTTALSNNVTT